MSQGIVCKVSNLQPIPKADRIVSGFASGYVVIVGVETTPDTLGICFPPETQLSHEMCMANKLYRKNPDTGLEMGGYLEPNRKTRAVKLKGIKSEALWIPIDSLSWTGADLSKLKLGDVLDQLNDKEICRKYLTPATIRAISNKTKNSKKSSFFQNFAQHYETGRINNVLGIIPLGAKLIFTAKLHGTSFRAGLVTVPVLYSRFKRFLLWLLSWFNVEPKRWNWEFISGTRRTVLDPETSLSIDPSESHKNSYRVQVHNKLKELPLRRGEVLYGEIVGYVAPNVPIMSTHSSEDKEITKLYKMPVHYSYGCDRNKGDHKVFIYRISMQDDEGKAFDLPFEEVQLRCKQLGLQTVPLLETTHYDLNSEALIATCRRLSNRPSVLDPSHPEEGVCVLVESPELKRAYKFKSWAFSEMEGIKYHDDSYIDPEDAS